jgi:hypothetical protein
VLADNFSTHLSELGLMMRASPSKLIWHPVADAIPTLVLLQQARRI